MLFISLESQLRGRRHRLNFSASLFLPRPVSRSTWQVLKVYGRGCWKIGNQFYLEPSGNFSPGWKLTTNAIRFGLCGVLLGKRSKTARRIFLLCATTRSEEHTSEL